MRSVDIHTPLRLVTRYLHSLVVQPKKRATGTKDEHQALRHFLVLKAVSSPKGRVKSAATAYSIADSQHRHFHSPSSSRSFSPAHSPVRIAPNPPVSPTVCRVMADIGHEAQRVTTGHSINTGTGEFGYPQGHLGHLTPEQDSALAKFKEILVEKKLWTPATEGQPASHDDITLLYA